MKKWIGVVVVALILGGWWWNSTRNANKPELKTATVKRGEVRQTISTAGKMVAERQVTLNFPASGKLSYIRVKEGDRVSKGRYMAGLDTGDLKASETAAYYRYLAADANAKEVEDSVKDKGNSETFAEKNDRVAAQTARDIAYDNWLTAKRAVANSGLVAPFDGVVTNVTISSVGDTVGVGDGITLVDPTSVYFSSEIDETDVGSIREGQEVKVSLDSYPGDNFLGTVRSIGYGSEISSSGATVYPVKVELLGMVWDKLRIGMNGDAEYELSYKKDVLVLPSEYVNDGKVLVLENEKEKEVEVVEGISDGIVVEVVGGLKDGDVVVIK